MFPTVRVSFSGPFKPTKPSDFYAVLLDIVPVDSRRYRYAYHRSAWLVAGKADPPPIPRLHAHPDTPFTCEALTKQVISFEKAKLTNNELDRNGQVSYNKNVQQIYKHNQVAKIEHYGRVAKCFTFSTRVGKQEQRGNMAKINENKNIFLSV